MRHCDFCSNECDGSWGHCEHCGRPSWFPNVDAANRPEELQAIDQNYNKAVSSADSKVGDAIRRFEAIVKDQSVAVLVRSINEVMTLFDKEYALHMSFHQKLRAGGVRFDGGPYDPLRVSIDSKIFPNYHEKITFAAASLEHTGAGLTYGECHLTLNTAMIEHRTSFFIGNSFHLIQDMKHADPIPAGLRSTWNDRGKLSAIRHAEKFLQKTTEAEFPKILNDGSDDFIEAHVYGSISRKAVQRVTVKNKALNKSKKVYLEVLRDRLSELSQPPSNYKVEFTEV